MDSQRMVPSNQAAMMGAEFEAIGVADKIHTFDSPWNLQAGFHPDAATRQRTVLLTYSPMAPTALVFVSLGYRSYHRCQLQ